MENKFWTSEKLLSLSALFVSLLTLGVFVYQTNLIRKQQYMSVYPHLSISNSQSYSLNYEFVLRNEGVGPAFIKKIEVKGQDEKIYESLAEYLEDTLEEKDSIWVHNSDIFEGKLIQAGEKVVLFGLIDESFTNELGLPKNTIEGAKKLRQVLNNDDLEIKIEYESIYGERWSIFGDSQVPIKE